jgi:hypothetical protein
MIWRIEKMQKKERKGGTEKMWKIPKTGKKRWKISKRRILRIEVVQKIVMIVD